MESGKAQESKFLTTRWSVVLHAARSESTLARDALAHLCETYWYPIYAYVRRRAFSPDDAQDMTQEFFAQLLEGNWVAQADPQRGRFRSFLLSAMKHFMANEWRKSKTHKRGGQVLIESFDDDTAEQRYSKEPAAPETSSPENFYERRWALTLLDKALKQLEAEYRRDEKGSEFETLRPALTLSSGVLSYPAMAEKLGVDANAARVAVHRLRKRYRKLLRMEVSNTVATPDEVDEEMEHLFRALSGG